jgi:hypothetical protein
MTTIIKFTEGSLGNDISFFRCNLSQASAPLQHWDSDSKAWVSTQYQCADCRHQISGMVELCHDVMADWLSEPRDEFQCDYEVKDCFGYEVYDANSCDSFETFDEAVERIADWFEDADQWADGNGNDEMHQAIRESIDSIEQPEEGGIDELKAYSHAVSEAVATAMGAECFAGHSNYYVSASDRSGIRVEVREIHNPE